MDPIEVVRTIEELWDENKLDELDQYFAPDFVSESGVRSLPPGLEGAKIAHTGTMGVFPDRRTTIEEIFSDGRIVCVRVRCTGTNKGGIPQFGIPPNDADVDFQWISIYEVEDGKVTQHRALTDLASLLLQTGAWSPHG